MSRSTSSGRRADGGACAARNSLFRRTSCAGATLVELAIVARGAIRRQRRRRRGRQRPRPKKDLHIVKSPIVGTFYESPSPGAPPFVKAGDTIAVGQVLCIVEAMKLMNEIESRRRRGAGEEAGRPTASRSSTGRSCSPSGRRSESVEFRGAHLARLFAFTIASKAAILAATDCSSRF